MKDTKNREFDGLFARLEDLKKRAARGDLGISAFLSPRELHYAESFLRVGGVSFISFGGYDNAERKRIYLLPEYIDAEKGIDALEEFGYSNEISVLEARGSGFETLSHRTFMGALLGLGVERDVIGDILMTGDNSAVVLCDSAMVDFLLAHWERAGRDKIKLGVITLPEGFAPQRRFAPISDTVASPRLDCVIGAICSLSREKAREVITSGLAELDYECEERPDREVKAPCIISVRGYGKFKISSLCDKTRKGRYRLQGEKFL